MLTIKCRLWQRNGIGKSLLVYCGAAATLVMLTITASSARAQDPQDAQTTAARLVKAAQEAAVSGNSARQFALLRQAVGVDPGYAPARWQLGQIQVGGNWIAVEEAQRRAAADPQQAQYRQMRTQYGESPGGQLALARWCRKNQLLDEAHFHWASVLAVDPGNDEALRALDMRWHNGQLASRDKLLQSKTEQRESKRAAKRWNSAMARWRRAIAGTDAGARDAALEEIRSLTDPAAIPTLEKLSLGQTGNEQVNGRLRDVSLAFVAALAAMPAPAATESLARHAVVSPVYHARAAAIEALKSRPKHEYVPLLLGELSMPIESSFTVTTDNEGSVHYRHSLYREGPESDWSADLRRSTMQHDFKGRRYTWDVATQKWEVGPPTESPVAVVARKTAVATRRINEFGNAAAATEWHIRQSNERTEAINAAIVAVLQRSTGQGFESPKDWWDWWVKQNEYYASNDRPVEQYYDTKTESFHYGPPAFDIRYPPSPPPRQWGSCFAKGTFVWTKTGQRPIESLELGDLVLGQNVETGELAYKPVIGRTLRPPCPILKLSFEGEELFTTRGHPFWIVGVGWRMAKELGDAAVLHAVSGSTRLSAVEVAGEAEAYNLVVAEFNTYFVGESGVLVHDNTPRRPTRAALPGLAAR